MKTHMKYTILLVSIFVIFLFFLPACQKTSSLFPVLQKAEACMESHPDSALSLLEAIPFPEKLPKEEYATWCLLVTQARDKNYVEHTSDSVINIAVQYFEKQSSSKRKAQSYYCQGRVLSSLEAKEEALQAYLKAKDLVRETTDDELRARINNHLGNLYWQSREDKKSLDCFKEAYLVYQQMKHVVGSISALQNIGGSMFGLGQLDSALYYLNKALILANQEDVTSQIAYLYSSLANIYEEQGDYKKALAYNKESLKYPRVEETFSSRYYALGTIYEKMQMLDSALFYAEKSLVSEDLYAQCSANQLLYDLSIKGGNYEKAYRYNERYLLLRDSIEHLCQPQELAKIEALYKEERLINKQNQQMQKARDTHNFLLICLLCACLASVGIYVVWKRISRRQKMRAEVLQRQLQKISEQLVDNQCEIREKEICLGDICNQLKQNERQVKEYREKIKEMEDDTSVILEEYQNKLNDKIEENEKLSEALESVLIEKKILVDDNQLLLHEKDRLIVNWRNALIARNTYLSKLIKKNHLSEFESKDWEDFFLNFETIFPGFVDHLNNLNLVEPRWLQICCLVKLGLKNGVISEIYDLRPDTITSIKAEIKKTHFSKYGKQSLDKILNNEVLKSGFSEKK